MLLTQSLTRFSLQASPFTLTFPVPSVTTSWSLRPLLHPLFLHSQAKLNYLECSKGVMLFSVHSGSSFPWQLGTFTTQWKCHFQETLSSIFQGWVRCPFPWPLTSYGPLDIYRAIVKVCLPLPQLLRVDIYWRLRLSFSVVSLAASIVHGM